MLRSQAVLEVGREVIQRAHCPKFATEVYADAAGRLGVWRSFGFASRA